MAEKVSALATENFFKVRAARADRGRFMEILDRVPDGPVQAGDEPASRLKLAPLGSHHKPAMNPHLGRSGHYGH